MSAGEEMLVTSEPAGGAPLPMSPAAEVIAPGAVRFTFSEEVVMTADPSGLAAESLRVLRTHLLTQHVREGRRGLAVVSPTEGVGCTSVAVNLAVALAQAGVKTLLIDADLRHPAVHNFITPSAPVPGLQQCLTADPLDLQDAVQEEVSENLSVLFAGGATASAQEMLAGERFRRLLDSCLRDYDITVIDTPPASSSADARQVSSLVSYALLVVGQNRTFVSDVKTLVEEMTADHAQVVGVALKGS